MDKESYYVDSSVYLNLWRKEVSSGVELWKIAKKFFDFVKESESTVYYSGFLLRELQFVLSIEDYLDKKEMFEETPNFKKVILTSNEHHHVKEMMNSTNKGVGFYDLIHAFLSSKVEAILVTRDEKLLEFCQGHNIIAKKPEEL